MSIAERDTARGSAKSPAAFRTISEVSIELDVPQHVLRFWESKFGQIRPMKRGGGRRYYRPEDLELLRGIRRLLYTDGYTIKGVQKVLRESGVRAVADIGRAEIAAANGNAEAIPTALPREADIVAAPVRAASPASDMVSGPAAAAASVASAARAAETGAAPLADARQAWAALRADLLEIRALLVEED